MARAERTGTAPKIVHLLTNSEYFNRAGSLVHTDPTGTKDADLPANTRVYMIASAPHGPGPFPPLSNTGGGMIGRAALNPLNYSSVTRALFHALDRWVAEDVAPPPSAYPRIADGTLTPPSKAGWPAVPGYQLPQQPLRAFHLNFGPDWSKGIVSVEPPEIGKPFTVGVPAVDTDGNVRAGIRLPDIAVPLATQAFGIREARGARDVRAVRARRCATRPAEADAPASRTGRRRARARCRAWLRRSGAGKGPAGSRSDIGPRSRPHGHQRDPLVEFPHAGVPFVGR